MAKIAAKLHQALAHRAAHGGAGGLSLRELAQGNGWKVQDVVCTYGPRDRAFEERHTGGTIAIVVAGSFQYRGPLGCELMTPGSLVLGNPGDVFECGHDHGAGDRCISFWYAPSYFERIAADAGARGASCFPVLRLPPLRVLSPLVARASASLAGTGPGSISASWEELSVQLAAAAVQVAQGLSPRTGAVTSAALARVTRIVRMIERDPEAELPLAGLAREAGLSPYHFLRTFQGLTGLTPHQYLIRARLRDAAVRLGVEKTRVTEIALDSGFGDLSNFNRAFRTEFGVSPRVYRRQTLVAN